MDKTKLRVTVSVFCIALAFGLNITGITPVLGVLSEKYARMGTSTVQLMQTLPYALLMAGSLLIGWLTTRLTKKKLVLSGMILIGVCGMLPFFSDSFALLFASRLLIGFGFGIVGPLNTAIIADFFDEDHRAGLLGLHVVGMGIGTMLGNLIGGVLSGGGYQRFFLVYALAFVTALAVFACLEERPVAVSEKGEGMRLNGRVYLISLAGFVHTLCINVYSTNVAIYVLKYITDNTAVTGIITTVNAAFALLVGAMFGKVAAVFKKYTLGFAILAAAAGYASMLWLPGVAAVYVGSALCGVSLSCFNARGSYLISVSVDNRAVAKASGMFAVIGGIGGLISPVLLGAVSSGIWGENTTLGQFELAFVGMLVLGTATVLYERFDKSVAAN